MVSLDVFFFLHDLYRSLRKTSSLQALFTLNIFKLRVRTESRKKQNTTSTQSNTVDTADEHFLEKKTKNKKTPTVILSRRIRMKC